MPRIVTTADEGSQPPHRGVGAGKHGQHDLEQQILHVVAEYRHGRRCLGIVLRVIKDVATWSTAALLAGCGDGPEPRPVLEVHHFKTEAGFATTGDNATVGELRRKVVEDTRVVRELTLDDLARLLRVVVRARSVDKGEGRSGEHLQQDRLADAVALRVTTRGHGNA